MNHIVASLRNNPELAIFLTLALGFLIGRIKFRSFSLDNVVGTLLAGVVLASVSAIGTEVEDREQLDFPLIDLNVVLTNRRLVDKTLEQLAAEHGRGVVLLKIVRGGEEIPYTPTTWGPVIVLLTK